VVRFEFLFRCLQSAVNLSWSVAMPDGASPLTLFYVPRTRAFRPRWLMEEIGLHYRLERMKRADLAAPFYRAIDPLGRVPVLRDGAVTVIESSAICLWLAERYGGAALSPPADGQQRADLMRWLFFAQTTLEPPVEIVIRHRHPRQFATEPAGGPPPPTPREADAAVARFGVLVEPLLRALDNRPFLLGQRFSVADVVVGDLLVWARAVSLLDGEPVLGDYLERLTARPAYRRARAEPEGTETIGKTGGSR